MTGRILALALVLTGVAHADFDRHMATGGQPDLYVAVGSGRIHVYPGSDSEIHVKAHVYAGWNAGGDIQDRIRRISDNPPISVQGNSIHIGDMGGGDRGLYNNINIDYEISAPHGVALNLHTGSGDIEIDNVARFLKADTGSGAVRAHGIAGPAEMHTGSGDIELQQRAGGDVKASTGSGSIRINGLAGGPLNLRSGSGDVEVNGTLNGPAKVQSGSGSIRMHLGRESRYTVDAQTGSGTIRVAGATSDGEHHHLSQQVNGGGPTLEAHTGSGDIEIN